MAKTKLKIFKETYFLKNDSKHQSNHAFPIKLTTSGIDSNRYLIQTPLLTKYRKWPQILHIEIFWMCKIKITYQRLCQRWSLKLADALLYEMRHEMFTTPLYAISIIANLQFGQYIRSKFGVLQIQFLMFVKNREISWYFFNHATLNDCSFISDGNVSYHEFTLQTYVNIRTRLCTSYYNIVSVTFNHDVVVLPRTTTLSWPVYVSFSSCPIFINVPPSRRIIM